MGKAGKAQNSVVDQFIIISHIELSFFVVDPVHPPFPFPDPGKLYGEALCLHHPLHATDSCVVCERRCSPQQLLVEILSCSKSLFISCCWNAHNMPKYQQDRSHSISIKSQSISIQFPWTKTIQSHWIGTIRSPAEVVEAPPELWAMLQVGHGDGFFQWNLYELIRISWEICDVFFFQKNTGNYSNVNLVGFDGKLPSGNWEQL